MTFLMKRNNGRKIREEQEKILIVCERDSEKEYCSLLKSRTRATGVSIKITDAGSGIVEVYKTAQDQERLNKKEPFDKIFCVFDDDNLPKTILSNL